MGTPNSNNKEDCVANVTTTSSSTNSTPDGSATTSSPPTRRISSSSTVEEKDNTFAMFIMALGVASAGGLAMKGRQTDSLLRRFSSVSKIQQAGRGKAAATTRSTVPTKTKLKSKLDAYDRNKLYEVKKTMHEKDDFF